MNSPPMLSLAEHVCLALINNGLSHGWALGTALSSSGEVGAVWSLSRALTYRAVDGLVTKDLVVREAVTDGARRERQGLAITPAGAEIVGAWLSTPVSRVRDLRTELLLKLALRTRAGLENRSLLLAQQVAIQPRLDQLLREPGADAVSVWRRESARSVRRFLAEALALDGPTTPDAPLSDNPGRLQLSARNQLLATVATVRRNGLVASVQATLVPGQSISATITGDAVDDLDLAAGDPVLMIMKATEVLVAKPS